MHLYWNLVEKHGFTPHWFPPPPTPDRTGGPGGKDENPPTKHILSYGNKLVLQLIIDGLKLQPCRPSFISARDAIILADEIRTHGDNYCAIWERFARRGLGTTAHLEPGNSPWAGGNRTQSFEVPEECT
ncbi:LOW QUALITY PROTEIN: putative metalloprotease [Endogone sp. FLAS-F59071]|nr:LOW QUALITY PROTEIN: putative metalloprotease [Endogone sp. FLAS-F59071]|eukprot:RUS16649.1 LOW QUALITY PROTEIN: putative metalloprotease [Endogone sp. FLAS-F59071]